jgi:large subunit ribosomal protein L10
MSMTIEEKKKETAELSAVLEDHSTVYLTDFTGLDVAEMTDLRARLREEGVDYRVAKNTLMARALEDLDYPELEEYLRGPTGLVLGGDDPVAPAKVVKDFAEDHEDRPVVKVGVVDRKRLTPDEVSRLAEMPTREELLASILGGLTSPVAGIVGVLDSLIRNIGHMAHAAAEKREGGEE